MPYKILTVDDSRTIRMIIKKAFEPYNCELYEAENGMEGLATATEIHPDLIVLDITMPVMTGIEMLSRLKDNDELKNIPVIMLTAESGKDNVMHIVKMGVKDYIVKPFKGDQLIDRAKNILQLSKDGAQPQPSKSAEPKFFIEQGDLVVLRFPAKISRNVGGQIDGASKKKIDEMVSKEIKKMIIDLSSVEDVNMTVIQVIITLANRCINNKISARIVAKEPQAEALKGFQETSNYTTQPSIEHAMAAF